ncbi:MAG: hypothetical protein IKW77_07360 [Salinivirgaceae bacterium]|nr:hypothetical protein [Salinivirgaceae bacterium]
MKHKLLTILFLLLSMPMMAQFDINHYLREGYADLNKSKNVYKQIAANGKFELCGWNASKGEWIRVSGRLITDDTAEAQEAVLDQNPDLKGMYTVLVTTYGLKQNAYSGSIYATVTADNLFEK